MKLINGEVAADGGEIIISSSATVAKLAQEVCACPGQSVFDVVSEGLTPDDRIDKQYLIDAIISQFELPGDDPFDQLSEDAIDHQRTELLH